MGSVGDRWDVMNVESVGGVPKPGVTDGRGMGRGGGRCGGRHSREAVGRLMRMLHAEGRGGNFTGGNGNGEDTIEITRVATMNTRSDRGSGGCVNPISVSRQAFFLTEHAISLFQEFTVKVLKN